MKNTIARLIQLIQNNKTYKKDKNKYSYRYTFSSGVLPFVLPLVLLILVCVLSFTVFAGGLSDRLFLKTKHSENSKSNTNNDYSINNYNNENDNNNINSNNINNIVSNSIGNNHDNNNDNYSSNSSDSNSQEYNYDESSNQINNKNLSASREMLQCRYYNETEFMKSIYDAQSINISNSQSKKQSDVIIQPSTVTNTHIIKGGIVPHHLLAGNMIASFFKTVSAEQPEIIVVIAPNHTGKGVKEVHTGSWSWQTPFGTLEAYESIVSSLVESKIATTNFNLLEEDHSISALVPYIKYYMPDSKIVPILLHGSFGLKDAQKLGQNLQRKLEKENKKGLIIASVDFSHYLPLEQAEQMDEISIKAIENRDMNIIHQFNNDYMDSPPSIITLLSAMDTAGAEHMKVLDHSNSDIIAGSRSSETTSYFTVVFLDKVRLD